MEKKGVSQILCKPQLLVQKSKGKERRRQGNLSAALCAY